MTSPTGRVIPFEHYRQQEETAWRMHQRMRAAMIASGAKEVGPDMFEVSGDYQALEQWIMEMMRDQPSDTASPVISGDSDEQA